MPAAEIAGWWGIAGRAAIARWAYARVADAASRPHVAPVRSS